MIKTVAFIVFPGFQVVDMAAVTVFEMANTLAGGPAYEILMVSEHGGPVRSSAGITVDSLPFAQFEGRAFDTVMLFGASDEGVDCTPGLVELLRGHGAQARRTATICTGALLMARTGLLEGRRVTTHWAAARGLQRSHPGIRVEEDRIFINDGKFWSSAGMTACIDLGLALVEQDLGVDTSRMIAKKMVVYHRRSGGQSQFSALLELEPKSDRIQTALSYAKQNLRRELSVDELADAASLSRRQFTRAFRLETGQSPAKAVETLRVEAARFMIESSAHSIETVARETGFADSERMRRAFIRAFGLPPQAIKRAAKLQVA